MLITQHPKNAPPPMSVVQQIVYLCQGEVEARDFKTAKVHALMLRPLLIALPYDITTVFLFLTTIHTMLDIATHTFHPSIIDFEHWQ